ncbi:MAG: hypothetical protein ACI9BD_001198, partial [Candidatus Marinamargulisbacteria bacterium]
SGTTQKFPGSGGWIYVPVPKKYTALLKQERRAWGMYPITVCIGQTTWNSKLMMKKGGDFFIALKSAIRHAEGIQVGDTISLTFQLISG